MRAGTRWKLSERVFLERYYCEHGAEWCAERLGRSRFAVCSAATRLGLVRYPKIAQAQQRRRQARDKWRGRQSAFGALGASLQGSALAQALGVTGAAA